MDSVPLLESSLRACPQSIISNLEIKIKDGDDDDVMDKKRR
jgi:hypothetical protein